MFFQQLKASVIITIINMITIIPCKSEFHQPVRENPSPLNMLSNQLLSNSALNSLLDAAILSSVSDHPVKQSHLKCKHNYCLNASKHILHVKAIDLKPICFVWSFSCGLQLFHVFHHSSSKLHLLKFPFVESNFVWLVYS